MTLDRTGHIYGRLTVLEQAGPYCRATRWLCKCECGNTKIIIGGSLQGGKTQSCGCLRKEVTRLRSRTHGEATQGHQSRTYHSWQAMHARCCNKLDINYKHYGGRGIDVCERWHDFVLFKEDMGAAPIGMSLDRIDTNGNYCKENCRWATRKEQNRNTRCNVNIEYKGIVKCVSAWAECLSIPKRSLYYQLKRGLTLEQIVLAVLPESQPSASVK